MQISSKIRSKVGTIVLTFVKEYFKLVKQTYFHLKENALRLRGKVITILYDLEDVVQEVMLELEHYMTGVKASLDFYINKYEELLDKYSGGNHKIFIQYYEHVKAEVETFIQELSWYLEKFEVFKELQDLYLHYQSWLKYLHLDGYSNTFLNTIKR